MKFLVFKFLITFVYLITTSSSYSIEQPDLKNIVVYDKPKSIKNVNFKDFNNKNVNLDQYKGKLLILNFWATWCKPCKEEMPSLDLLQSDIRFDNLKIFTINVGKDSSSKSEKFFKELKIKNLEIYSDPALELPNKFSLRGIPTTIFINKEGKEFSRLIGSIDFKSKEFVNWLMNYK